MRKPRRDQIGAAGRAQCIADRDQRAEHDEDRPFDRVIGLAQGQRAGEQEDDGGAEKGDGHRDDVESDKSHGGGKNEDRQETRFAADAKIALGQRQAMQFAERLGHGGEIAPEHDDVAGPKLHRAQTMGDAPAFATYREQIDRVAVEQLELTDGAADQARSSA